MIRLKELRLSGFISKAYEIYDERANFNAEKNRTLSGSIADIRGGGCHAGDVGPGNGVMLLYTYFYLFWLFFLKSGNLDFQNTIFKSGFYQIRFNPVYQCKKSLERAETPFASVVI